MVKPFLLLSCLALLTLSIISLLPAFAEHSQQLSFAMIAISVFLCLMAILGSGPCCSAPEEAVESAPEPKAPESHLPDLNAVPEQNAEVQVAQLLGLLQEKGRFLDFVMDDIKSYPDAQIAAAARFVHQGCQSVMKNNFTIEPVATVAEGQGITLADDYERADYRLSGKVGGEPPHAGTLKHKGWKTSSVSLPKVMGARAQAAGAHLLAPAEVELS